MDLPGQPRRTANRRAPALALPAVVLALTMAIAAPAFATTNTVETWGAGLTLPTRVAGLSGVTGVAAGGEDNFALLHDSTARSWGNNEYGEHGDGTNQLGGGPPGIATVGGGSPLSGITALSSGRYHALALLGSGKVMAWGRNNSGQLGIGNTTGPELCNNGAGISCSRSPIEVSGLSSVTAISANGSRNLALISSGTVMTWGAGSGSAPGPVSGLKNVVGISAGDEHSLALLSNGTVMAWGANGSGQLGNGTTTNSETPVAVSGLSGVAAISAGRLHSLALLSNGTVMAWGANGSGQLGNGTTTNSDVPVAVGGLAGVAVLSAGGDDSLALTGGTVMAWGANGSGSLGNGTTTNSDVPLGVGGLREVGGISAGTYNLAFGPPRPIVTEVSPQFGGAKAGGTTLTVTGTDFTEATAVHFGSASAASFIVNSATSITAVSPAGSGTVDVTVISPAGTSPVGSADKFNYFFLPTISRVAPHIGPVGGGTTVKITGTHFSEVTRVSFGSIAASSFIVNSETSITAVTPAATAGTVDVTITTTNAVSAISSVDHFKFVPTVTGLSPSAGSAAGGTSVSVTGTGFAVGTSATRFKFGATLATSVNCSSSTTCTVVSPAHAAGTVDVKATVNKVASAKSRPADQFTYS
jgi:alpha-tubulin suppressor-like RCC1 family protein